MIRPTLTAVATAAVITVTAAAASADDRLVYHADETGGDVAVDASSYHNDGVLRGRVARDRGAYRFHYKRGVYDRIVASDSASLDPDDSPFAYSARVRVPVDARWGGVHQMTIVHRSDTHQPGGGYKMELELTDRGAAAVMCHIWDGGNGSGFIQGTGGLDTIADGTWHRLVCARVDADTVSLTVDGHTATRETTGGLGVVKSDRRLVLGAQPKGKSSYSEQFVGRMGNVRISTQ